MSRNGKTGVNRITGRSAFLALLKDEGITHLVGNPGTTEVRIAEPLVKWAVEVTRLEDLPRIVRRAAKVATTPPTGPVFISLPGDILNSEAGIDLGRATRIDTRVKPSDESLQALVQRILKAQRPVIIAGDEIV